MLFAFICCHYLDCGPKHSAAVFLIQEAVQFLVACHAPQVCFEKKQLTGMVVEVLVVGWEWLSDSKLWTSILEMILLNMTNFLGPLVLYVASQTRMFLRPPSFSQRFVVKVQHLWWTWQARANSSYSIDPGMEEDGSTGADLYSWLFMYFQ